MRILVTGGTGGTGYIGSHMVLALLRDGHSVRLLVRRPEQVAETFGPHGITFVDDDVVTGDVLDGPARRDLGITPIPFEQSIRDEIEWAVDAGHLPAKYRPR